MGNPTPNDIDNSDLAVAIIGLAGRFPGAATIDAFWSNLRAGVESISFFSDAELLAAGTDPTLLHNPHYIKSSAVLNDDIALFDAPFFGMSPHEADNTDPQHRIFLECAHEALEHAGYDAQRYAGAIGIYAGVGTTHYRGVAARRDDDSIDAYQMQIGTQPNYLATRVAYKLNLRGPSVTVQTACSTSLVAVHMACQSLFSGECDIVLAGGVSIRIPQRVGYLYQPGSVLAPDGHCRAFDVQSQGTVPGSGAGVVVLKRLAEAIADGDMIYAVIRGSAINNDGSNKVGYMAPSVAGQTRVIHAAYQMAGVTPDTISYIEAHGTGTALGDPIEVAALTDVFRSYTQRIGFCALGSLKTNIGHLDIAAGVAGLIKATLALYHGEIPPSLHFTAPNPQLNLAQSPFFVNTGLVPWPASNTPRRAGVSAFGIGGTNVHIVLEAAPRQLASDEAQPWQLLTLSARTPSALECATADIATYLRADPDVNLADLAYMLQVGRRAFAHRRVVICQDRIDAIAAIERRDGQSVRTATVDEHDRPVVFLFPGGSAQYVHMARGLYATEPVFRAAVDDCAALLMPHLQLDLRDILYPHQAQVERAARELRRTTVGLPALFVTSYALAQLWMAWGITPIAMAGHSLGEYVAACLAGVFSLDDALALVALRGRLFAGLPPGAMLSVPLTEHEVNGLLGEVLSLAVINTPGQCVVSGPVDSIDQLAVTLAERGIQTRRLSIDVAAHSAQLEPILEPFFRFVATLRLQPPTIPIVSNVTGTWMTDTLATDPRYWVRHLRETVRFSENVEVLVADPQRLFLEVGPGRTLSTLVTQHPCGAGRVALPSLRHPTEQRQDRELLLLALGRLWLAGAAVDWSSLHAHERRQRLRLPTYPFQRQRYWLEEEGQARRDDTQRPGTVVLHERPLLATTFVTPRTPTEQTLAALWQRLFGVEAVGIHDNFFDLGGDSLLAVQMIAQIQNALQVELPAHSLIQVPTIAGLAVLCASLATNAPPDALAQPYQRHPSLVPIQPGGSVPPLFLIHPIGGGVYLYQTLARLLGPQQPVYGLQAKGFEGDGEPLNQVAEMATYYREAIVTVQPQGPYLLGGASFGGVVAFELAQQLRARGQQVALLALLDSPAPNQHTVQDATDPVLIAQALRAAVPDATREEPNNPRLQCLVAAHLQALYHYQAEPYAGQIVYFRAGQRDDGVSAAIEAGWVPLAQNGLLVYEVPGDHRTMLALPHVNVLAGHLRRQFGA